MSLRRRCPELTASGSPNPVAGEISYPAPAPPQTEVGWRVSDARQRLVANGRLRAPKSRSVHGFLGLHTSPKLRGQSQSQPPELKFLPFRYQ